MKSNLKFPLIIITILATIANIAIVAFIATDMSNGSTSLLNGRLFAPNSYIEDGELRLDMKMIYVEGGTFQMGATPEQSNEAEDDEWPVHSVTLSSYYIAECEVTQAQWEAVMGSDIYDQNNIANGNGVSNVGSDQPMYYVNWDDANEFCNRLSRLTGKNYTLPTEAQWEYAARGGKYSKGYKYSGTDYVNTAVWCRKNSSATRPVKEKAPNELGLYDMSGNVYEWCSDWYGDYPSEKQKNPEGVAYSHARILRGGSWYSKASSCRVSNRYYYSPSRRNGNFGFRVVCIP